MKRLWPGAVALSMLLAWETPACAVRKDEAPVARPEALDDAQLGQVVAQLAGETEGKELAAACRVVPYFDELERRRKEDKLSAGAAFYRGLCHIGRNKPAEALLQFARIEQLMPVSGEGDLLSVVDGMSLYAAANLKDWKSFAEHAGHIVARNDPNEFPRLETRLVTSAFSFGERAQVDGLAVAFVRASSFARLPVELRQNLSYRAARSLARSGDMDLARRLVAGIGNPSTIVSMLADREFAAFWPDLDKRAVPHLRSVLDGHVDTARAKLASNPADMDAFGSLVSALVVAGRYREAVDLAKKIDHSPAGLEKIVEGQAWALNAEVKALDRLGRPHDADRVFDALNALDWESRSWMVNFAINRADRLVGQGRWQEALRAADHAVAVAEKQGSPYAKEVALVDWLCAVRGSDPMRDVSERWAVIEKNWKDNIGSAVQAAMCVGDRARAVRFLRDGLNDVQTRSQTIVLLQPKEADLFRDADFMIDEPRTLLNSDRELRAAFDLYAREIPLDLLPVH